MPKRKRRSKKRKGKSKRKKKKSNGVKRGITSFLLFSKYNRPLVKKKYPDMKLGETSKKLGELWRGLTDQQKEMWKKRAKEENEKSGGEPDVVRRRARDVEQAKRSRAQPSDIRQRARILQRAAGSLQSLNRQASHVDSKLPWLCKSCHKKNISAHASCSVCGTRKDANSIQPPLPSRVFKPRSPVQPIVPAKFKYPRLRNVLTKLKLEHFYAEFEKQQVSLETLVDLVRNNDEDLKELIKLIGPRRELKSFIQKHYINKESQSDDETIVPSKTRKKLAAPMPSPVKKKKLFKFVSESDSDSSSESDPPILFQRKGGSPPPQLSTFSQFERRESQPDQEELPLREPKKPAEPPRIRQLPDWCQAPLTKPFPRPDTDKAG